MNPSRGNPESSVAGCLAKCADAVTEEGHGRWNLEIRNGSKLAVSAFVENEFLLLESAAESFVAGKPSRLLESNRPVPGTVKFAACPTLDKLRLRAEIALTEEADLAARVNEQIQGFLRVRRDRDAGGSCEDARADGAVSLADAGEAATGALPEVLSETVWTFKERDTGSFAVDLECQVGFHQALLAPRAAGVYGSVELVCGKAISPSSVEALAVFFLTVNGCLRLARGYLERTGDESRFGFEVQFATVPQPSELHHTLAALSVACQVSSSEAKVLLDPRVARLYLAARCIPTLND